jgi:rod shape-determining protein MreB
MMSFLMRFGRSRHSRSAGDIAVDLGTANTLVYARGRGIVLSEPSVIAVDSRTGEVHAVGDEARRMIGRTPATISATRPLRHGVIADYEVAEEMLRYFIGKVDQSRFARPRVVMCVPSGVTGVEVSAVEEACRAAGAREVHLMEEPVAAAIGAGLEISQPSGNMVLDIGGGTSEMAVISMGAMVVQRSLAVGGYDFDEAIINLLRINHELAIGQPTAEALKLTIGSVAPLDQELVGEVRGRQVTSGLPRSATLSSQAVRTALAEPLEAIIEAVKETLEATPPELAGDIVTHGILLAGGGSMLRGLAERIHDETHIPTRLAESPLTCVAIGAGHSLEELDALRRSSAIGRSRRTGGYSSPSGRSATGAGSMSSSAGSRDLRRPM